MLFRYDSIKFKKEVVGSERNPLKSHSGYWELKFGRVRSHRRKGIHGWQSGMNLSDLAWDLVADFFMGSCRNGRPRADDPLMLSDFTSG
jgi:hypothetical protein